jgi:hypothetical protein
MSSCNDGTSESIQRSPITNLSNAHQSLIYPTLTGNRFNHESYAQSSSRDKPVASICTKALRTPNLHISRPLVWRCSLLATHATHACAPHCTPWLAAKRTTVMNSINSMNK